MEKDSTNRSGNLIAFAFRLVSVDAQINNDYNEKNDWTIQHKLDISKHQLDKTFVANGVDEAKMNIVIKNKTTNILADAQSDIEVLLSSKNGIVKPRKILILKGKAMSEDISITSPHPGNASIIAEAVGFEVVSTSVEFEPPKDPQELLLIAFPTEDIPANGNNPTKLTVKLLDSDDELFISLEDRYIDIWTNRGETLPQIKISKEKPYGRLEYKTCERGTVNFTARSPDFGLEGSTEVTFISPITLITSFFAALGGSLAGFLKYYREHEGKILVKPKKIDGAWRLGISGNLVIHSICGVLAYIAASLSMPGTNIHNLPISTCRGAFMVGLIGGFFFFCIKSLWGFTYKSES